MARGSHWWNEPPWWAWVVIAAGSVFLAVGYPIALHRGSVDAQGGAPSSEARQEPEPAPESLPSLPGPGANVLIVGDSYSTGYGADDPATEGYVPILGAKYGWDVTVVPVPGGGYTKAGPDGLGPFSQAIARELDPADLPDAIVVQGGLNDAGAGADALRSAASETLSALVAAAPDTPIIVVGLLWPSDPPGYVERARGALSSAVTAVGGIAYADTEGLTYPTITDQVHPTTAGYQAIASRIADQLGTAGLVSPPA